MVIATSALEAGLCPKCGTRTLEQDQEGDTHCWGCGATFVQNPDAFPVKPVRRGSRLGVKMGHRSGTAGKVEEIVRLYNEGCGLQSISQRLSLSTSTVRNIVKESGQLRPCGKPRVEGLLPKGGDRWH